MHKRCQTNARPISQLVQGPVSRGKKFAKLSLRADREPSPRFLAVPEMGNSTRKRDEKSALSSGNSLAPFAAVSLRKVDAPSRCGTCRPLRLLHTTNRYFQKMSRRISAGTKPRECTIRFATLSFAQLRLSRQRIRDPAVTDKRETATASGPETRGIRGIPETKVHVKLVRGASRAVKGCYVIVTI
jgi:hypothetical protein